MTKRKAGLSIFLMCVIGTYFLMQSQAMASIGISPATIKKENVRWGHKFDRTLTIFNSNKKEVEVIVQPKSEMKKFITVLDNKTRKEKNKFKVKARKQLTVLLRFEIPKHVPIGRHTGEVSVVPQNVTIEDTRTASKIVLSPSALVDISITDKQIVDVEVKSFYISPSEYGNPLNIKIGLDNRSNVDITPTLRFTLNKGEESLKNAVFQMKTISYDKTSSEEFILGLTDEIKTGEYMATGVIEFAGVKSEKMKTPVKILPPGSLSKGTLESLTHEGSLKKGNKVVVRGKFASKSIIPLNVKMIGDIYVEGLKIGTIESKTIVVKSFQNKELTAELPIMRNELYKIDAYCMVGKKESNHRQIELQPENNLIKYILAAVAGLFIAILGILQFRRARPKSGKHLRRTISGA